MSKKIIRIQPREFDNRVLPYPYFIDEKGLVGRQDFWKGKPFRLLGFNREPATGDISLMFADFRKSPKKAVGMYPVFTDKKGNWTTHTSPIESVSVERITK